AADSVSPLHVFVDPHGDLPIRAEIFGLEHLEAHARQVAAASALASRNRPSKSLLLRLAKNGRFLGRAYKEISEASCRQDASIPAYEWLLDNFYIVEEALREVRQDLPRGYYAELPKLAHGPLAGYPRIYALALALIAHTDSGLSETNITRFVQAYQSVVPL